MSGCPAEKQAAPAPVVPEVPKPIYDMDNPTGGLDAPRSRDDDFRRGVSLGLFVSSEDDAVRKPLYQQFLDEIAEHGATDLQLVVRWSQSDIHANQIAPDAEHFVDDAVLRWVMDEAKARDLRVFLMPTLHVRERAMGKWRGTIEPTDWDDWWWNYQRFIMNYARIAQNHDAALFSVGSELLSTERQDERWRDLIKRVRRVYKGQLTYSANWDHFEPVSFWDALDVVGVTGYQELSSSAEPSDKELLSGYRPFMKRLHSWAMAKGVRYIFTEVGYPSQAHAASRPWDYRNAGAPDLALQMRCYRALYQAWQNDPRLAGLYMWNWFGEGGPADGGYTPRNKPAARVLSHWYKGSRPTAQASTDANRTASKAAESAEKAKTN